MDFPDPGIEPGSPALQVDSLPTELSGKPTSHSLAYFLFLYEAMQFHFLGTFDFFFLTFIYFTFDWAGSSLLWTFFRVESRVYSSCGARPSHCNDKPLLDSNNLLLTYTAKGRVVEGIDFMTPHLQHPKDVTETKGVSDCNASCGIPCY